MSYTYLLDESGKISSAFLPSGVPGTIPNINQVLTAGSDAGLNQLTNLSYLKSNGYIEIGNAIGTSSQLHLCYSDGTPYNNNYQIIAVNDELNFQFYKKQSNGSLVMTQAFSINGNGGVTLSSNGQCFVTDGTTVGQIYDSHFNPVAASGTLQGILTANPSAGNESLLNVGQLTAETASFTNLNVANVGGIITVENSTNNVVGSAYTTFNPPQIIMQSISNTQSLSIPYVTDAQNNTYWKLFEFNTANYPNCNNFTVNVTNIGCTIVTPLQSGGTYIAEFYLIDNLILNSITTGDLIKSLRVNVAAPMLDVEWILGTGSNIFYQNTLSLQYFNTTSETPKTLGIVFLLNDFGNLSNYLMRNAFQCTVTASSIFTSYLDNSS